MGNYHQIRRPWLSQMHNGVFSSVWVSQLWSRESASGGAPYMRLLRKFSSSPARRDLAALIEPTKYIVESVHAASGLPWPAVVPLSAVLLRLGLTTPLAIKSRMVARKQAALQPLLSAMIPVYKAQLAETSSKGGSGLTPEQITILAAKERRKQRIALYREQKCQNWRILLLPAVQIPLFVSMSLCIRALCGWTAVDGIAIPQDFHDQPFLWLHSLVMPDPNGILPLMVGGLMLANIELQASQVPQTRHKGPSVTAFLANVSRLGSIIFMALTFQAPSAIGLYWATSNAYSLVQNLLLNKFLPVQPQIEYPDVDAQVAGLAQAGTPASGQTTKAQTTRPHTAP